MSTRGRTEPIKQRLGRCIHPLKECNGMIDTNELRRLAQAATPGPWMLRTAPTSAGVCHIISAADWRGAFIYGDGLRIGVDDSLPKAQELAANARLIAAANPAAISELLDSLEAAESECLEQARLNGMGSEREAALMAKLEAAEKERDECNRRRLEAADHFAAQTALMKQKYDDLRVKVAEMEQQEPVGVLHVGSYYGEELEDWEFEADQRVCNHLNERHVSNPTSLKLYALPGAQPAPSINEGVRKVTLGFRWESEAQHHIPTIEIEFDPVSPDSPNDAKGWQDRDRIASMLSPESKS